MRGIAEIVENQVTPKEYEGSALDLILERLDVILSALGVEEPKVEEPEADEPKVEEETKTEGDDE